MLTIGNLKLATFRFYSRRFPCR